MAFKVGSATIDRVEEQRVRMPIGLFTDDVAFVRNELGALPRQMLDRADESFQFCFQSWIIRVDGLVVIVDPCNGNGRSRPGFEFMANLDSPWLENLREAGVAPEDVDLVFCTHLHCDHCGWNVRQQDGRWVPTFPNARYIFAEREFRRWDSAARVDEPGADNDYNISMFEEAVRPVVETGQAEIVALPFRVSPSLVVEAAEGHTVGHAMLRLSNGGGAAYFTGDAFHHPAQVHRPELHLRGCDDLEKAIVTRRAIFARASSEGAFLFPAHLAEPHHGRTVTVSGGFAFVSGGAEA
jgi:glyoxylase-like metal-dependent hydrolase (beta-lactamase superfamily II)